MSPLRPLHVAVSLLAIGAACGVASAAASKQKPVSEIGGYVISAIMEQDKITACMAESGKKNARLRFTTWQGKDGNLAYDITIPAPKNMTKAPSQIVLTVDAGKPFNLPLKAPVDKSSLNAELPKQAIHKVWEAQQSIKVDVGGKAMTWTVAQSPSMIEVFAALNACASPKVN